MYDVGIDGLDGSRPRSRLVREILREEYPDPSGATPSHREDLVADLLALGATREQVLAVAPDGRSRGRHRGDARAHRSTRRTGTATSAS